MTGADLTLAMLAIKNGRPPPWVSASQPIEAWLEAIPLAHCEARLPDIEEAFIETAKAGRREAAIMLEKLIDAIDARVEAET